jgi:hypothetical protein
MEPMKPMEPMPAVFCLGGPAMWAATLRVSTIRQVVRPGC